MNAWYSAMLNFVVAVEGDHEILELDLIKADHSRVPPLPSVESWNGGEVDDR